MPETFGVYQIISDGELNLEPQKQMVFIFISLLHSSYKINNLVLKGFRFPDALNTNFIILSLISSNEWSYGSVNVQFFET